MLFPLCFQTEEQTLPLTSPCLRFHAWVLQIERKSHPEISRPIHFQCRVEGRHWEWLKPEPQYINQSIFKRCPKTKHFSYSSGKKGSLSDMRYHLGAKSSRTKISLGRTAVLTDPTRLLARHWPHGDQRTLLITTPLSLVPRPIAYPFDDIRPNRSAANNSDSMDFLCFFLD